MRKTALLTIHNSLLTTHYSLLTTIIRFQCMKRHDEIIGFNKIAPVAIRLSAAGIKIPVLNFFPG
jgi:hypothetical protein